MDTLYGEYDPDMVMNSIELNLPTSGNPSLYHYYEKDWIWNIFEKAIRNKPFMRIVFFNNDYLKIAPVHTFSAYYIDGQYELSAFEKNSIGRLFKFVFEVFGYSSFVRSSRNHHTIVYGKVFN